MSEYSHEVIEDCVRQTFSTPQGTVTLAWLRDLYVNYRSQAIVQSSSPNLSTQLGYRLGSQDVVLMIEQVIKYGFSQEGKQETEPTLEGWHE